MNQTRTLSTATHRPTLLRRPKLPESRAAIPLIVLAACTPAYASDYSGFLSGMTSSFVMMLAAVNALFVTVFGFTKQYRSRRFANWHAALGSVPPLLGLLATLIDASSISYEALWFGVNGAALALALLPLWLAKKMAPAAPPSSEQNDQTARSD